MASLEEVRQSLVEVAAARAEMAAHAARDGRNTPTSPEIVESLARVREALDAIQVLDALKPGRD